MINRPSLSVIKIACLLALRVPVTLTVASMVRTVTSPRRTGAFMSGGSITAPWRHPKAILASSTTLHNMIEVLGTEDILMVPKTESKLTVPHPMSLDTPT